MSNESIEVHASGRQTEPDSGFLWSKLARPLLFKVPAEKAHYSAMAVYSNLTKLPATANLAAKMFQVDSPVLQTTVAGLKFKNPVGLAAGFDKDARWYNQLGHLGFSHLEVGTLTAHAQQGNPQPRLFRLPEDTALLNRMGFNNGGAEAAAKRFEASSGSNNSATEGSGPILGINIGKSKVTAIEAATDDYLASFKLLKPHADYVTINVSSPNTPGLRKLQEREPLLELLAAIQNENENASPLPIFLKLAPDLNEHELADIADIVTEAQIAGVIATNTTVSRENLATEAGHVSALGDGGVSGAPLTEQSLHIVAALRALLPDEIPIIGVGGIMNGADAWRMICAGANLIQVYTGFIYGGPGFVKSINQYLVDQIETSSFSNIAEAVGSSTK